MPVDDFNDATRLAFPTPADLNDTVRARVYCGPQSPIDASNVAHIVVPVLNLVGTVDRAWSLQAGQPDDPSVVRFYEVLVRYSNIDHTLNAIRALNGVRTDVCTGKDDRPPSFTVDEMMLMVLFRNSSLKSCLARKTATLRPRLRLAMSLNRRRRARVPAARDPAAVAPSRAVVPQLRPRPLSLRPRLPVANQTTR